MVLPWLQRVVVVIAILLLVETFLLLGVVTPVVIEGSSMAPSLLGAHLQVECPHCGWEFEVGADQWTDVWPIVCADCCESFRSGSNQEVQQGRRVWVDRTRYAFRQPRRWEVVVFRCPEQATQLCVKRVIGLPGELVSFSGGDLFVHGQVVRKSLSQQQQLRQLVHRERKKLLLWQSASSDWQRTGGAWRHQGDAPTRLTFYPAKGIPVTDDLGINQRVSRRLNVATDLMVTCEATLAPDATLEFQAIFPTPPPGEAALAAGRTIAAGQTNRPGRSQFTWSLFDRQSMLTVDGQVVHRERSNLPWPSSPRLALLATGDVTIHNLSVWRDATYHTRPDDRWPAEERVLAAGEFFVVGDNVAISADSRNWAHPGLSERWILGSPLGSPLGANIERRPPPP